jgi:phosphoglycerate dehydrogenase-like enzyme
MDKPLILIDPLPRTVDSICDPLTRRRLESLGRLVISEDRAMPDTMVDQHLPETVLLFGQTAMPRERIEHAGRLKAIFNVETNFLPNIDYAACRQRGVWVLSPTSSFAEAVAESALSMAIDLARVITVADRAFRAGTEKFGLAGNEVSFMFTKAPVGIIGLSDLGGKLRALIRPFRNPVRVYDPWLPDDLIRSYDCEPVGLDDLLASSRVVFVFASVTTENQGFLGEREFASRLRSMPAGTR